MIPDNAQIESQAQRARRRENGRKVETQNGELNAEPKIRKTRTWNVKRIRLGAGWEYLDLMHNACHQEIG